MKQDVTATNDLMVAEALEAFPRGFTGTHNVCFVKSNVHLAAGNVSEFCTYKKYIISLPSTNFCTAHVLHMGHPLREIP